IAILLPGLQDAREQAKRVVCRSNLAQVNKGLVAYVIDLDSFPIRMSYTPSGFPTWCTWSYGGWTGKNTAYWQEHVGGTFFYHTTQRPLSVYMQFPGTLSEDEALAHFKCPNDEPGLAELFDPGAGQALSQWSSYDDVGTSYRLNMRRWFDQMMNDPECASLSSADRRECAMELGRLLWKRKLVDDPGRFVTLLEEPANFGLFNEIQTVGWHKQFSRHVTAFLDGHVDYVYTDTRYDRGRDWTVVDEDRPHVEPPGAGPPP
ncbi:MAG: hypothetical protein ACE5E6_08445, partial [Phycisphaerae bacterium]